jgi:hypothetical protein
MKGRQEVEYLPRAWKVPIVKKEHPNKGGVSRLKELYTPEFWAEGYPGKLNRESWVIEVNGLCANPKTFT